jgi:hypothetical protein
VSGLLTTSDLRRVDGMPTDVQAVAGNGGLTEDTDPRGPCGTTIAQPDLSSGATIGIGSASISGVQSVLRPTKPSAAAYLDANIADAKKGCAPWSKGAQRITLERVIPAQRTPASVDQQLGVLLTIEQAGQTAHAGIVYLRAGDRLSELALLSPSPIEAKTLEELVVLAAARLGQP